MHNIKVVIGSSFGDCGKGLMTDYFAHQAVSKDENCIVVCSNGGSQRSHTVSSYNGFRHAFRHFGSGSLVGADTYLSKDFILNPIIFREEWCELEYLGITPKIFVHKDCIFTTPFEMIINQIVEESREDNRHGSCGMGIWETIVRNKLSYFQIEYFSKHKEFINYYVISGKDYLFRRLKEYGIDNIPEEWKNIIDSDYLIEHYISDFFFMLSKITLVDNNILKDYQNIVFENGQGLLLDQNIQGYGEHTTPSNTGLKNPKEIIESVFKGSEKDVEVCYVTRTYLTRHGAGPFPTECLIGEINPNIVDLTNIYNPHQGNIRYGRIDVGELIQRIYNDFRDSKGLNYKLSLAITHLNETNDKFASVKKNEEVINLSMFNNFYLSDGMTRESVEELKKEK